MAFLSDFSKKISQTGQEVVQKAKENTEIFKLDGTISDENKKINELYNQIGKLYFETHTDSYEELFSEIILQIHSSKAKINECEAQISRIKGIKKCPQCGTELSYEAKFCNSCGLQMNSKSTDQINQENTKQCPQCNGVINDESAFCENCGYAFSGQSSDDDSNVNCKNCGEYVGDASFCPNCGTKR